MQGVNKAFIIGNLGGAPEMRYTPNGAAVTSFSVAVNTGYGDYKPTDWFNVESLGKEAESANDHLKKGDGVWVEGQMLNDKWEDDEGNKRSSWKLKAWHWQFVGSQKEADYISGEKEVPGEDIPF